MFKFSDNRIHFEFENVKFSVKAESASIWLGESIGVLNKVAEFLRGSVTEDDVVKSLELFVECFDALLGSGATAQIFGARKMSIYDCYDVYAYVVGEITQHARNKRGSLDFGKK